MQFLIFSDLHQFDPLCLRIFKNSEIKDVANAIIFLGDINSLALQYVCNTFPNIPVYGVLGNHDTKNLIDVTNSHLELSKGVLREHFDFPIVNLNLNRIETNEISFCGFEGSVTYREHSVGYTQEEALSFDIPKADILFSHETGDTSPCAKKDSVHNGYTAISKYIKEKQPRYHIFGHHHQNISFKIGKTKCFCVYGCSLFNFEAGTMQNIF